MTAEVHEVSRFRNRSRVFQDRFDGGDFLAGMLEPEYRGEDVIVLAIPSGGVPVGCRISDRLGSPLDLVIVRKLQIPGNPEAGFGAMTLEGSVFLNERLMAELKLDHSQIQAETERVKAELEKRDRELRKGKSFPDPSEKRVILVDDGLASGYTMFASIYMVKKREAREIVVAVPTAPQRTVDAMLEAVHRVYCPNIRETPYFAVAEAYRNWYDLDTAEVQALLKS